MAQPHPTLSPELTDFIRAQPIFFVSTAPLSPTGHINLSPKGLDSLRVLSPTCVAYLDLTGSGNETAAHISENARITLMFCAFEGKPIILRLYGRGAVILPGSKEWPELSRQFILHTGARQIITCDIDRVQTSCGMAVPLMQFTAHRDALLNWAAAKGDDGLTQYRQRKNRRSIDGIATPFDTSTESHGT